MIQPTRRDDVLLADIAAHGGPGDNPRLHIWWLGQSGFLVKHDGHVFLFAPYLSDSLTEKYAGTANPHIRMTARCVDPALLPRPRVITASHIHTDHLDPGTLRPLAESHPGVRLALPAAILEEARARLAGAPIQFHPLHHGIHMRGRGWQLIPVPAAHEDLKTDAQGRHHYLGYILRAGPFTLYHSGDTLWHDGLLPALCTLGAYRCHVMLLPINGRKPERGVAGNLNGTEAAALARACSAHIVIPCHYEMFTFNTEPPDEFAAACGRLGQAHALPTCGGRVSMTAEPA